MLEKGGWIVTLVIAVNNVFIYFMKDSATYRKL